MAIIQNHMHKIWDEIKKPEHFQNVEMSKIFNIRVEKLPSFLYEEGEFVQECN